VASRSVFVGGAENKGINRAFNLPRFSLPKTKNGISTQSRLVNHSIFTLPVFAEAGDDFCDADEIS
jgi:hypothetical protein